MANEIWHNYLTSKTLYAAVFRISDGQVYLTNASGPEVWGAGGNDADDYDVAMTETNVGNSMHYIGTFLQAFAAGVYRITIYQQAGVSPADSDTAIAQAEIHWDGTAEIDISTLDTTLDAILVADRQAVVVINEQGTSGGGSIPIVTITQPSVP